jgi:pimeloyl-ACP methyl ester carboxylesterase
MKQTLILAFTLMTAFSAHALDCTKEWKSLASDTHCEMLPYRTHVTYPVTSIFGSSPDEADVTAKIRAGYMEEAPGISFKGNVLYFQGLADSMLNHRPLFEKITAQGFRVIAFDYMGQGGSTGSMNDTRLADIPRLGKMIYKRYARELNTHQKPIIMGWSTGGLAAYLTAIDNSASKVILLAPGIVPKVILGEQDIWQLDFDIITVATLTSKRYSAKEYNPHVDGIRPRSPLDVKDFATDLILTSMSARFQAANSEVKGLVLLSGTDDSYVNSVKGANRLGEIAPSFKQVFYPNSLHEIDNEIAPIQKDAQKQIVNFLLQK